MSKLKSYSKNKNETLQMMPEDIINDILTDERYMDIFGICTCRVEVKNGKLIADIKNDKNHIYMCLNMKDIAKRYGYKYWQYIELVSWDYSEYGSVKIDHKNRTPSILFFNHTQINM